MKRRLLRSMRSLFEIQKNRLPFFLYAHCLMSNQVRLLTERETVSDKNSCRSHRKSTSVWSLHAPYSRHTMYITIDETDRRPFYRQVVDEVKSLIARGELPEGS